MRYFLLMLLLAAANAFAGDLVMPNRDGTAQMRLLETSCSEPNILAHLKPEARAEFRNMHTVTTVDGTVRWLGCWWRAADGDIVVVLSDGASMRFPAGSFKDPSI